MFGHLPRRRMLRSSATPICPTGGDGTGRFLCRSFFMIRSIESVVASRTRRLRARHKRCSIYVLVYLA